MGRRIKTILEMAFFAVWVTFVFWTMWRWFLLGILPPITYVQAFAIVTMLSIPNLFILVTPKEMDDSFSTTVCSCIYAGLVLAVGFILHVVTA